MRKPFSEIIAEETALTSEEAQQALAASRAGDVRLGGYLVQNGLITPKSLQQILQKRKYDIRLGDLLVETGVISKPSHLELAINQQEGREDKIGEILKRLKIIEHDDLMSALCLHLDIMQIKPEIELAHEIAPMPTTVYMEKNRAIPYFKDGDTITVVMNNPLDETIREEMVKFYGGKPVVCSYASGEDLDDYFTKRRAWKDGVRRVRGEMALRSDLRILEPAAASERELLDSKDSSKIFEFYLRKAIDQGASDLHIEPLEKSLRIRFAIDGMLHTVTQLPPAFGPRILGMLKAACRIDITKQYLPSDGRLVVKYRNDDIGLRMSTFPCLFGENCVIRVVRHNESVGSMDDLGFSGSNMKLIERSLGSSSGVVLVTGPTGSGKTTTLYTALRQLQKNKPQHIITVEDPVEYTLHGVTQGMLNVKMGFDYTTALSAIMRQNPDTIMVGEVRDPVTARTIIQAALTGHKVFSTLHTETAIGALMRLNEMGVESYLLNETVELVIAQRLARKTCRECRQEMLPSDDLLRMLNISKTMWNGRKVYYGEGRTGGKRCANCNGSGYKGQVAIHEVLYVNADISRALEKKMTSWETKEVAKLRAGFISFKEDGLNKVLLGETTFEEMISVLPDIADDIRPIEYISELCQTAAGLAACHHSANSWGAGPLKSMGASETKDEPASENKMEIGRVLGNAGLKLKKIFSAHISPGEQGLSEGEYQALLKAMSVVSGHCQGPMEENSACRSCKEAEAKAASALDRVKRVNGDIVVACDEKSAYLLMRDNNAQKPSWKIIAAIPIKKESFA